MSDSDRTSQANGNGARPAPFAGITVLDFSHQAAGPWATTLLGDLGANVIKIEKPGRGDAIRYVLEINGGLAAELGIELGAELRHPAIEDAAWPCA